MVAAGGADNPVGTQLARWVDEQLAPWRARPPRQGALARTLTALNESYADIFIYDFSESGVSLRDKPHYPPGELTGPTQPLTRRAKLYLDFFRLVADSRGLSCGTLALTTEDFRPWMFDAPIFAFQKRAGENFILLPDPDALTFQFYGFEPDDTLPFREKRDQAFFTGATTGSRHTLASVRALEDPRVRAGVYFKTRNEVDFRLPRVVQCDGPQAEGAIRALGFGGGGTDWTEHLRHKFLISMDGNGATCSRVAKALRSRCVLLKYASPFALYYFSGLQPGRHYLPIVEDRDVIDIVRTEQRDPGHFEPIAAAGRDFFADYIARGPGLHYAATLLAEYFATIAPSDPGLDCDVTAALHMPGHGDAIGDPSQWLGLSNHYVEAFKLLVAAPLAAAPGHPPPGDAGGTMAPPGWVQPGETAGTRGQDRPIFGYAVRLAEGGPPCRYSGRFGDGGVVGPCADGAPCLSRNGAPLQAIQLHVGG